RRNPAYRRDWLRCTSSPTSHVANQWGLRLLEDPDQDARDAQPDWLCDRSHMLLVSADSEGGKQAASHLPTLCVRATTCRADGGPLPLCFVGSIDPGRIILQPVPFAPAERRSCTSALFKHWMVY